MRKHVVSLILVYPFEFADTLESPASIKITPVVRLAHFEADFTDFIRSPLAAANIFTFPYRGLSLDLIVSEPERDSLQNADMQFWGLTKKTKFHFVSPFK